MKEAFMHKTGLHFLFLFIFCLLLNSCATTTTSSPKTLEVKNKNIEFNAVLTDPIVKTDFRSLKSIAMKAPLLQNENHVYFDENSLKKLDEASAVLIDRLQNHYHLNADKYKIHTFIGRNKTESCYQYYDSSNKNLIGKTCEDSSSQFGSCKLCENYVNTVRARTMRVIHAQSRRNTDTMALIDTFKLRNGDFVYLALELSPEG
jgi:hypothetical protein